MQEAQSHAAKVREPRQVRKEAALNGVFRVPWGRWVSRKGHSFSKEAKSLQPKGYLPFKSAPRQGDKLILFPIFIYPVEILERGLLVRPSYDYYVALVNGFNKKAELLKTEKITPVTSFDPSVFECRYLALKVPVQMAETLAEYGAVPEDFRSWRRIVRSRRAVIRTETMQLVWHVYALRGDEAVDTFTGEAAPVAGMVDLLFSSGTGLAHE